MRPDIHPEYKTCNVRCACGSNFETRATVDSISVEICSQCHPFFTGTQRFVDTEGRVDRFNRKFKRRKSE